jgi:siderophore synthetase component
MTPKEKALDLIDKYSNTVLMDDYETKRCVLITVNEIIDSLTIKNYSDVDNYEYWKEVKQEIEKL